MKKITILAGASLLVIAGSAFAEQSLTDAQMDGVNAGAVVVLNGTAGGSAYGDVVANLLSTTSTNTSAFADPTGALTTQATGNPSLGVAAGFGTSTSVATSVLNPGAGLGGAYANSASGAASSIF